MTSAPGSDDLSGHKTCRLVNKTRSREIASSVRVADNFVSRFIGLLASPPLQPGQGLLITPCSQIHMFGMKFAIDVVFIDKNGLVVGLVQNIGPGKISPLYRGAHSCIELPVGAIEESATELGDTLEISKS